MDVDRDERKIPKRRSLSPTQCLRLRFNDMSSQRTARVSADIDDFMIGDPDADYRHVQAPFGSPSTPMLLSELPSSPPFPTLPELVPSTPSLSDKSDRSHSPVTPPGFTESGATPVHTRQEKNSARKRLKSKTAKATLNMKKIANAYRVATDIFNPNLVPLMYHRQVRGSCRPFQSIVTMWNGSQSASSNRKLVLATPRVPWFYDCSIMQNITFVVRMLPSYVPEPPEANWIALNICKVSKVPSWSYFDTILASLECWAKYADLVVQDKDDKELLTWNDDEKSVVEVCFHSCLCIPMLLFKIHRTLGRCTRCLRGKQSRVGSALPMTLRSTELSRGTSLRTTSCRGWIAPKSMSPLHACFLRSTQTSCLFPPT